MVKDAAISIRVEPALKSRLEAEASAAGLPLAAYAERALEVHSRPPKWQLHDPEVIHSAKAGTTVKLNVAEGWPVALLTIAHAEALGRQLTKAAEAAKKLPGASR